jgi:glycerol-3-phosphate dehydrogenase
MNADASVAAHAVGLSPEVGKLMVRQHGDAAADVLALTAVDPALHELIVPVADHIMAEVVYAVRHEGACTLQDVLARRTRISLRSADAGMPKAREAAQLMAKELDLDEAWAEQQVIAYRDSVRAERGVAALDHV